MYPEATWVKVLPLSPFLTVMRDSAAAGESSNQDFRSGILKPNVPQPPTLPQEADAFNLSLFAADATAERTLTTRQELQKFPRACRVKSTVVCAEGIGRVRGLETNPPVLHSQGHYLSLTWPQFMASNTICKFLCISRSRNCYSLQATC